MHMHFGNLLICGINFVLGGKTDKISGLNIVIFTKF